MADDADTPEALRQRAAAMVDALRGPCGEADLAAARGLLRRLRDRRLLGPMGRLAEALCRLDPRDATVRRHYAQYLIDTGHAMPAIDMLTLLVRRLPDDHPEAVEAAGLIGRAWKQVFFDSADRSGPAAREALKQAVDAYRRPYERDEASTWHGVNLLALLARARALGLRVAPGLEPAALARDLLETLQAVPPERQDAWHHATLAEVHLGLRDWEAAEDHLHRYVTAPGVAAFHVGGTLRQLTDVWAIGDTERGRQLLDILRARQLSLGGGEARLAPEDLQRLRGEAEPSASRLEAILGIHGAQTYRWWRTGIERASAVAAIRQRGGGRVGTGFLVRAGDLGRTPADELLVLTNFHVVNADGSGEALRPGDAEVAFEAVDAVKTHPVEAIVWSSPVHLHDAALLRVSPAVEGIAPLPIAANLPVVEDTARVYVIGHPGGRDLSFSFQDNELLDHEGPPAGRPPIAGVVRVHYRAPTEGGSSGSPVFNARLWQVIALHHLGGRIGVSRLNGQAGTYGANEGIAMASIVAAIRGAA